MPETVLVHLSSDRFTQGFYRMDGNTLVMTYSDGNDVEPPVTHAMRPGDNAQVMAAILTKEIRSRMISPFWDEMKMPENGVA